MFPFADVMPVGPWWKALGELQDPKLRWLAGLLPQTMLRSRANSTSVKYMSAFQRWRQWAEQHREVKIYPVQEVHFALYLQHLGESVQTRAAVEEAVNGVGWVHQLGGQQPIAAFPFVQVALEGLQHTLAKPKICKEPITAEMLMALVNCLGPSPGLADVRLAVIALLAFSAFLHYEELAKLRGCDIQFSAESMSVHITSSKTDQYRQGVSVLVATRSRTPTCPVDMLECYFAMAGLSASSKLHLFRGIIHVKAGDHLRAAGSLSYTRMRELVLAKLSQLGYDPKLFSLHSLRSGGASAAANAGVADRLFKHHRHWQSEAAKDGYVRTLSSHCCLSL